MELLILQAADSTLCIWSVLYAPYMEHAVHDEIRNPSSRLYGLSAVLDYLDPPPAFIYSRDVGALLNVLDHSYIFRDNIETVHDIPRYWRFYLSPGGIHIFADGTYIVYCEYYGEGTRLAWVRNGHVWYVRLYSGYLTHILPNYRSIWRAGHVYAMHVAAR